MSSPAPFLAEFALLFEPLADFRRPLPILLLPLGPDRFVKLGMPPLYPLLRQLFGLAGIVGPHRFLGEFAGESSPPLRGL